MITKENLKENFPTVSDVFLYAAYWQYLKNIHYPTNPDGTAGIKQIVRDALALYFADGMTPEIEQELIEMIARLMADIPNTAPVQKEITRALGGSV